MFADAKKRQDMFKALVIAAKLIFDELHGSAVYHSSSTLWLKAHKSSIQMA